MFSSPSKGLALGNQQQEGSDAKEAIPRLPGQTAGWWGPGGRLGLPAVHGKWSWWELQQDGVSGHPRTSET